MRTTRGVLFIQGAQLIDGPGRARLSRAGILVGDGRIMAVGRREEIAVPLPAAEVLDALDLSNRTCQLE